MKISHGGNGGIVATIIADSVSQAGQRITTLQLKYPRFIHAEFMTHRMFSRNASSSRAIPVAKMLKQVREDPAMPIHWGANQRGMQANGEVEGIKQAQAAWTLAAEKAAGVAEMMADIGLHKQVANRILEPFQFMHTVVTATEWDNFFALRDHKDAQPEIRELAVCMKTCMDDSLPALLLEGEWHVPYVTSIEHLSIEDSIKCSAARCARVSYLNHDKSAPSVEGDLKLYNMLAVRPYDDGKGHLLGASDPVHLSPLEHQATSMDSFDQNMRIYEDGHIDCVRGVTHFDKSGGTWSGNFRGMIQWRQMI